MNPHLWWYVARSTGLVAWALLTFGVMWGLVLSGRLTRGRRPRPAWVLDLHRFVGGLSVVFVAVHVSALLADQYTHFTLSWVLVPLASKWHPVAVAWGIAGLYVLVAIEVSSLARRFLPAKAWRAIHYGSVPLFVIVDVHAFAAGTDSGQPVVQWVALVSGAAVLFLFLFRVLAAPGSPRPRPVRVPQLVGEEIS